MKTFFKLTALAVITILLAVSCSVEVAPRFEQEWYEQIAAGKDANQNTGGTNRSLNKQPAITSVSGNLRTPLTEAEGGPREGKAEISVTFPNDADVFVGITTGDQLVTAMKNFLKFYTYTKTTTPLKVGEDSVTAGWLVKPEIPYKFVSRNGNTVIVELEKTIARTESNIIAFVDATKYTYGNGNFLDKDNNGVSGEKDYDDFYTELAVDGVFSNTGSPNFDDYEDFVFPGNAGWYFTLNDLNASGYWLLYPTPPETDNTYGTLSSIMENKDTSTARTYAIATFNGISSGLNDTYFDTTFTKFPYNGTSDAAVAQRARMVARQAIYDEVVSALAPYFRIERFENGKWVTHATAALNNDRPANVTITNGDAADITPSSPGADRDAYMKSRFYKRIAVKNVQFSNGVSYRTVFEIDDINKLQLNTTYNGVKQRVYVTGGSEDSILRNKNLKVVSDPVTYYNYDSRARISQDPDFIVEPIWWDNNYSNFIVKAYIDNPVVVYRTGTETADNFYYMKDYTNDMSTFNSNFKIYRTNDNRHPEWSSDLKEIKYGNVKFSKSEYLKDTDDEKYHGVNVIEITLDSSYKFDYSSNIYFYAGPNLVFANNNAPGGKPTTMGGDSWFRDGWTSYLVY